MNQTTIPFYALSAEPEGHLTIDEENISLSQRRWLRSPRGEVYTNDPHQRRSYELGHLLLKVKSGVVRHLNGDGLDFRKENLSLD